MSCDGWWNEQHQQNENLDYCFSATKKTKQSHANGFTKWNLESMVVHINLRQNLWLGGANKNKDLITPIFML